MSSAGIPELDDSSRGEHLDAVRKRAGGQRSAIIATILVVLGLLLAAVSSVPMFFARFMGESGAGLDFSDRLLVSTPMVVAVALLIGGANLGLKARGSEGPAANRWQRPLFVGGTMLGVLAGLVMLGFLVA